VVPCSEWVIFTTFPVTQREVPRCLLASAKGKQSAKALVETISRRASASGIEKDREYSADLRGVSIWLP
jgi:hypothetical protein